MDPDKDFRVAPSYLLSDKRFDTARNSYKRQYQTSKESSLSTTCTSPRAVCAQHSKDFSAGQNSGAEAKSVTAVNASEPPSEAMTNVNHLNTRTVDSLKARKERSEYLSDNQYAYKKRNLKPKESGMDNIDSIRRSVADSKTESGNNPYSAVPSIAPSINCHESQPMPFHSSNHFKSKASQTQTLASTDVPERLFMTSLLKHTAIALTIIVPLAAMSAYAAEPAKAVDSKGNLTANSNESALPAHIRVGKQQGERSQATPAAVDAIDLSRYAGVWYEIGRLPMYFQRKCAGNVTATYTPQSGSQAIAVLNQCDRSDGKKMVAEGEATPVDASGSKLKVSFLPKWLRWAPFGRANYWVLAIDDGYQSALVGTPDKKYLWLLSRSPSMNDDTYQSYRQIAQNQGYDLSEFKLTPQDSK